MIKRKNGRRNKRPTNEKHRNLILESIYRNDVDVKDNRFKKILAGPVRYGKSSP